MCNKFYITRYQSGSAVYGRVYTFCWFKHYKNLGIKTIDQHEDCVAAALAEIRKLDESPIVHYNFNDTPAEQMHGHW